MDNQTPSIEQKRQLVNEEFRRRAGQTPSSAGIGADAANNPTGNPIATADMTNPAIPSGGAAGSPTDGAQARMKTEKGEATKLGEALVWRMKKLTAQGQ